MIELEDLTQTTIQVPANHKILLIFPPGYEKLKVVLSNGELQNYLDFVKLVLSSDSKFMVLPETEACGHIRVFLIPEEK